MGEHPQLQFRCAKKFGVALHARRNFNSIFDPISFQRVIGYIQFFAQTVSLQNLGIHFFPFSVLTCFPVSIPLG
ncbi:hypothetical protein COLO4_16281 [Corchorus olitorius]|uniref:Uncharacterized protein n=1 Tax=Corchorus olitorius TaxID=93759 RepID=A0A1R3JIE0_9ROSI|nr:hypothetical protein COLO4_16281 [Corchorus olitorius]